MFPKICTIGPFTVYSYGLMLAVAVLVCARLMIRDARRYRIAPEKIYDLVFAAVIGGIIGGRIFYILLNISFFVSHPFEIVMLHHGGLAWQGGLMGGVISTLWFIRRYRLPLAQTLDLVAPYIALGQAIGRIGCFLNGCCYGREVSWGLYFPVHRAHLHPTQLYAAGGLLVIFFVLKKFRQVSKVPGQVLVLYLVLASSQRFVVEFFRADHDVAFAGLSIFQIVSILILLAGLMVNRALAAGMARRSQPRESGQKSRDV